MICTCNTPNARPPCGWCTRPLCTTCGAEIMSDTEHWREPRCEKCLEPALDVIPTGHYCYKMLGVVSTPNGPEVQSIPCPYWGKQLDLPKHENGRCSLMPRNDWEEDSLSMLWDQVKECGLNIP